MLYRFSDEEVKLLKEWGLQALVLRAADFDNALGPRPGPTAKLLLAARIVAELHEPTPSMREALAPGVERAANHLGVDMIEAAAREGVDLEKELGRPDPRANHPRCVHGRKMPKGADPGEPCADCSPAGSAPDRLLYGSARQGPTSFVVTDEERQALDRALAERLAVHPSQLPGMTSGPPSTACTCDSTLVTDTSDHQPQCPRHAAQQRD